MATGETPLADGAAQPVRTGSRLGCAGCALEVVVTKAGEGASLSCHGALVPTPQLGRLA